MAKKTRKQKQRSAARRSVAVRSPAAPLPVPQQPLDVPGSGQDVEDLTAVDDAVAPVTLAMPSMRDVGVPM